MFFFVAAIMLQCSIIFVMAHFLTRCMQIMCKFIKKLNKFNVKCKQIYFTMFFPLLQSLAPLEVWYMHVYMSLHLLHGFSCMLTNIRFIVSHTAPHITPLALYCLSHPIPPKGLISISTKERSLQRTSQSILTHTSF